MRSGRLEAVISKIETTLKILQTLKTSPNLPLRKMAVIGWASENFKFMSKQTAVDFLSERYNYITWMRNRDEISAGTADEWRAKFLKEAKEMEKEQIIKAHLHGVIHKFDNPNDASDNYYNDTFTGVV